jgi:DNA-binding transcriptional LysR family regulator
VERAGEADRGAIVELRHLRYFVAVAELGSLARAARQLNVAQSALSQQIQDLERELGAPLLERLPRGMQTTPAGRAFLEHARRSLAEADAGAQAVREVAAGASGLLRIGTADWGTHAARVGEAVACLRARAPGAAIAFDPTAWTEQPPAIVAGRIDVGFCPAVRASDLPAALHAEPLDAEPVDHVLIASTHPLARRDVVSLADLVGISMLLPERAVYPAMYDHCLAEVRRAGREPQVITAPTSPAAAVGLVASGAGFIMAMRSFALAPPPGTVALRLADWSLHVQLFALRRRSDERPFVMAFLDCLCAVYHAGPRAGHHGASVTPPTSGQGD